MYLARMVEQWYATVVIQLMALGPVLFLSPLYYVLTLEQSETSAPLF